MKVGFVVYALQPGGAERTVSILANGFAERGDRVVIMTLDDQRADQFFRLNPGVAVLRLGSNSGGGLCRIRFLRKLLKYRGLGCTIRREKFDAVVSFTTQVNVLTLLASIGSKIPVFVSERSDPAIIPRSLLWRVLRWLTYRHLACGALVQSGYAKRYFEKKGYRGVAALNNPVVIRKSAPGSAGAGEGPVRVFAVGRLAPEKRYDLLLLAIHRLKRESHVDLLPGFECCLIGDGPLYGKLSDLVRELDIEAFITMPGFSSNPWSKVHQYDIFVQCSDFEGFPNALVEAMSIGCAVVTTDYSPAVTEIVDDRRSAIVVERGNAEALAQGLRELIRDDQLRRRIGDNARLVSIRFEPEKVVKEWRAVLTTD